MYSANTDARPVGSVPTSIVLTTHEPIDDWLYGANEIARFLFGSIRFRRRVYYLADKKKIPVLHLGGLCARKSTLTEWLEEQERNAVASLGYLQ